MPRSSAQSSTNPHEDGGKVNMAAATAAAAAA